MNQFPLYFNAETSAIAGVDTTWTTQSLGQNELIVAIPPEFEGHGGGHSPEDLYLLALTNCFVATFKFAAHKSSLLFDNFEVQSKLVVDLDENKRPIMKEVHFKTFLYRPNNIEKAKRLLSKIEGSCLILNSVKSKIIFHHEVVE